MNKLICGLSILASLSCGDGSHPENDSAHQSDTVLNNKPLEEQSSVTGCYIRVTGRDTLLLQLQQSGEEIAGTMKFDNYEKDSSSGTVLGKEENGQLVLWYSFDAEGMHSWAQHVFKRTNDGLLMATGEITAKGDSSYYKDLSNLQFAEGSLLTKAACED